MKKICFFLLLAVSAVACHDFADELPEPAGDNSPETRAPGSDGTLYYWYQGEKVPLTVNREYVSVIVSDEFLKTYKSGSLLQKFDMEPDDSRHSEDVVRLKFISGPATLSEYDAAVNSLKEGGQVKYVLPFFERGKGAEPIGTSDVFYLKLKNPGDIALLEKMAKQLGVRVVGEVPYTPLWYVLSIDGSDFANSIKASNHFYETGYFQDADPAFLFDFSPNAIPDDPMFDQLWGLENTSHLGVDINAVDAWGITRGAGAIVAVVDQGIDPDHNDLSANFHPLSFDAQSGTSPSVFGGSSHGTRVAGTVAAVGNNNLQVVGVAHQSRIMRVSHDMIISSKCSSQLASGINWAWQSGADVINNSWGDQGGQYYSQMHSSILENAIVNAMTLGREGKGCVVVFAAGNFGQNGMVMDYPGNFHDNILTVGSIDQNGSRSIFSGYGTKLDIVAPGGNILSTIPDNRTGRDNGTSYSAPHAAGVAALVLSKYPQLTQKQVVDAIEMSAKRVGNYSYAWTAGRFNGRWNSQMGYGLLDAYAALLKAGTSPPPATPVLDLSYGSGPYRPEERIVVTVWNSQPNVTYTWSTDGTILSSQHDRLEVCAPIYPRMEQISVDCRATLNGVSAYSNTLWLPIDWNSSYYSSPQQKDRADRENSVAAQ